MGKARGFPISRGSVTDEKTSGVGRRDFLKVCTMAAAAVGLSASTGRAWAEAAAKGLKPSVIWLHFQECTGCTESLLRTSHPAVAELILDLISLDYHETLFAAAGHQAEDALKTAMEKGAGKYICVVEGGIPTKDGGIYCQIAGRTALDMLKEVADKAGAIIAIGSCASWGGIQAADPNPTGAKGAPQILEGKTVVSIPGCPPNPYNFLGAVLQLATFGTLPALDEKGRPKFPYGRTIHESCPRRAQFDAGHFAHQYGDDAHRNGACLFSLGCKGPYTHAPCATIDFGEVPGAWPIGIGHPCIGCTEAKLLWRVSAYQTIEPPPTLRPVLESSQAEAREAGTSGGLNRAVVGAVGVVGGALVTAGVMAARKGGGQEPPDPAPHGSSPTAD